MGQIDIKNERGERINLSTYQKNALYKQAKDLKSKLTSNMCRRNELDNSTERNVRKFESTEMANKKDIEKFRKIMRALDSDPRDRDLERYRR